MPKKKNDSLISVIEQVLGHSRFISWSVVPGFVHDLEEVKGRLDEL